MSGTEAATGAITGATRSDGTGDAAAARGPLTLAVEPFDGPAGRGLVADLMRDLDERYAADGPGEGDDPELVGHFQVRADQVTPPRGAFVVARLGGRPVACGAVRRMVDGPTDVAEIKRMYTVPGARRRGVSRAVLARLEAEAASLGYRRVQLETGRRQPEAIAMYRGTGYHEIPTFGQYAGDELSVCFAKDLTPRP